jgi:hypothetical protein
MLLCCLQCNKGLCAPCSTLWSADAQQFLFAHISQNTAIVVTMAKTFNSHLQYSAVFQHLYHGPALFLYKTFDYFWQGRSNKHPKSTATPSDSTWNTGWVITHTDMLTFLYYTDNLNQAHYNFTAVYMWYNVNYIDKCYTNIHT